jgi:small conductance mechanosensitive channel
MSSPPVPDPGDKPYIEACGTSPRLLCKMVLDASDNERLAEVVDWFVARPFTIVCILIGAWILTRLGRRLIKRAAYRLVLADPELSRQQLRRLAPRRLGGREVPSPVDLDVLIRDPRRHARATSISTVLGSTVTVLVWTVTFILVLGQFDIDLAPIIAGAGIAGVALGFGAQSLVKDCLTGLFMLIEDQFGIGDDVDLGEVKGTVEQITLRATVLRGVDGTVWHVPNGAVARVGNKSQRSPEHTGGEDGAAATGVP